ncbi:STAS domain-containing protein [Nocardia sp. NPDC051030]|uniref:STAS domain-containing protein n=1 Tax=Nocardia sp. NPDC051030 TaxID=3155162 RepID=UPI00341FABA3
MSAIAVLQRGFEPEHDGRHPPQSPDQDRRCVIVRVEGELDAAVLPEFSTALERAVGSGSPIVLVDFRHTRFLSIGCAGALAAGVAAATIDGVDLRVAGCRRAVERVLEVTGVRSLLDYYPSLHAALGA